MFVALIDGEYQVITHIRNIPQELSENIELSPYSNDNAFTIQPKQSSIFPEIKEEKFI